jgi:hypothetical protein
VLQIASQVDAEAAMREVFTTFTALQHELFGDDVSRWQRLGLVAAVSCVPSQQRCMYWLVPVDERAMAALPATVVVSSGVKSVLQELLVAASMHLTNFVDAGIPDRWGAAVRVLQDDRKRGAVFGGSSWMVPWREFTTRAQHSLSLRDDVEALAFARHVEKIGAVVLLGSGCGIEVLGGDNFGDRPQRWVVCILHDPEVVLRMLLPSREIVRVQVARVSETGEATGMQLGRVG